jgi:GNAT superfamily N-acetyltransferase
MRTGSGPDVIIRAPLPSDAPVMARLLEQLGYAAAADSVPARVERLGADPRAVALVAERDGLVVGLATAHALPVIHLDDDVAWLTALVVASDIRGLGLGRALVEAVERWGRERGCVRLSVTTALSREDAHGFYERLGLERTGLRYSRWLVDRAKPDPDPSR